MAIINLKIDANASSADAKIKALQQTVTSLATAINSITPNKNLTAQLNALSKAMSAVAKNAQAQASQQRANAQQMNAQTRAAQAAAKVESDRALAMARTTTEGERAQKVAVDRALAEQRLGNEQERGVTTSKRVTESVKGQTAATERGTQSVLSMAKGFLQWQLAATLIMAPINLIRNAVSSLNETLVETESKVVELQRVLPSGSATNSEMANEIYDIASEYGQSFENVSQIAENFAKAGYDWNETIDATRAAVVALNVAELDAGEASEGMIAIMKQFGYEAKDLMGIIDIIDKTGDHFAVTSESIYQALQRSGSAASNANLSLEETVGLVTALSEATGRKGSNIGTALNSLIVFSQKSKSLDTFSKLSDDTKKVVEEFRMGGKTIADVWEEVAKVMQNANARQKQLLAGLQDEDFDSLNDTLKEELGDIFAEKTDVYGTVGAYRQNYFAAFLKNVDTYKAAALEALDAEGYAIQENTKYMDTYEAKINTLEAEWGKLENKNQWLLETKKDLAEAGVQVIKFLDSIGGIPTVLRTVAAGLAATFGVKMIRGIASFASSLVSGVKVLKEYNAVSGITAKVEALNATALKARATAESIKNGAVVEGITAEEAETAAVEAETAAHNAASVAAGLHAAAIAGIMLVVFAVSSAIENYKARLEEAAQKAKETADQSAEWATQMSDLEGRLSSGKEKTEDLTTAFNDQLDSMGALGKKIKEQVGNYDDLSEAIARAALETKKKASADAKAAKKAAEDEYFASTNHGLFKSTKEFLYPIRIKNSVDDIESAVTASEALRQSLDELFTLTYENVPETTDEVLAAFEALEDVKSQIEAMALANPDLLDTNFYKALRDMYDYLVEDVTKLREAKEADDAATLALKATTLSYFRTLEENQISSFIGNLDAMAEQSGLTKDELAMLIAQEIAFDNTGLSTSQQVGALQSLAAQAGATRNEISKLIAAEAIQGMSPDTIPTTKPGKGFVMFGTTPIAFGNKTAKQWADDYIAERKKAYDAVVAEIDKATGGSGGSDPTEVDYDPDAGKTSSGSKESKSTTDAKLEALKDIVALRESELTLMQKQGASDDKQAEKMRQIQDALHAQAEYMRENGGSQTDINKLSAEWYDWQEKILELEKKRQEERKKQFEEERKLLNEQLELSENQGKSVGEQIEYHRKLQASLHAEAEYLRSIKADEQDILALSNSWYDEEDKINKLTEELWKELETGVKEQLDTAKQLRDDQIKQIDDEIEAMKASNDAQSKKNDLLEKEKAVREAIAALEEAENERNVRVFNEASGTYEWQANAKTVKDAKEALQDAQDALNDYREELAYEEAIEALEARKDAINAAYDVLETQWDNISKSMEKPARTIIEVLDDIAKNGTPKMKQAVMDVTAFLNNLTGKKAGTSIIPESALSSASPSGGRGGGGGSSSLSAAQQMQQNSIMWHTADAAGKEALHNQNQALGASLGATYDSSSGKWYKDGKALYDNGGVLSGMGGIKGTLQDEVVLPPSLAKKILSPASNAEFNSFVKSMGLLFGASHEVMSTRGNMITNSRTDNSSNHHNTSTQINGVPISSDMAERYTVAELVRAMKLVN